MDETSFDSPEEAATRVIVLLLIVAAVFAVGSIAVVYLITHNFYASSYYTLSTLFDANGEGASNFIATMLSAHGYNYIFYSFVGISIIDGLAKAVIIGFIIAAFLNLLSGIDLKTTFDVIAAKRLKGHVIICGYSMLAERLCIDLKKSRIHFVIIETLPDKVNLLRDLNFNVVEGNFTERKILESASISNAKAIIFATESDFINLLGIVTAHHMEPKVRIITRAKNESSVRKMQRGGAELCLVPEVVAGVELGESVAKV